MTALYYCRVFRLNFLYRKILGFELHSPLLSLLYPPLPLPPSCPYYLTRPLNPLYPPWQCDPAGFSGSPWSGCPGPTSWWRCPLPHWTACFCDRPGWTHCFGGPYTGIYNKGRITMCIWMEKHTLRTKDLKLQYITSRYEISKMHNALYFYSNTVVPLLLGYSICQETVATLEKWPLAGGRSKYINNSRGKDLWPY